MLAVSNGKKTFHPGNEYTGGGLVSTAADLTRFFRSVFTGEVTPADFSARVVANAVPWPDSHRYYGYGVAVENTSLGCSFGHGGWTPHYLSYVSWFADSGISVAVMINTDNPARMKGGKPFQLQHELATLVHDSLPGLSAGGSDKSDACIN